MQLVLCPDVSAILDIGGQDMKCCKVCRWLYRRYRDRTKRALWLQRLHCRYIRIRSTHSNQNQLTKEGLLACCQSTWSSRCTVFMNSKVKRAQKKVLHGTRYRGRSCLLCY
ncbi:MAG: hypothetical protein ACLUPK_05090 [Veillonella sp.]